MASSLCQVKIGAGSYAAVAGGINVSPGDAITIKLASSAGVGTGDWSISCVSTDETQVAATITALLTVNQTTFEATFTVPSGAGQALIFRSQVGSDTAGRTTFGLYTLVSAMRTGALDEVYEGSSSYGWVTKLNALIRVGQGTKARMLTQFGEVSTAAATTAVITSFTMLDETSVTFDFVASMKAVGAVAKAGRWSGTATYYRTGGGAPTLAGAAAYATAQETTAGDDVAFSVSGNIIRVLATSADVSGRNWFARLNVQEVLAT